MTEHKELIKHLRELGACGSDTADMAADALESQALEMEGLRKDAERYRWLRDQGALADGSRHPHMWRCIVLLSDLGVEHADEAIDAAMAAKGAQ